MIYFFINLVLHIAVSFGLLMLLLYLSEKNRKRTNKRGIYFLLPVVIVLIFLYQVITFSVPRVLDSVSVLKNNYQSETGVVESIGFLNHSVTMNNKTFYYNPFMFEPQKGDTLVILYTPNAHYAYSLSPAAE